MIPNSIQSIEPDLFTGCSNLKTVRYNGSEEAWKELRVHSSDINNATVYFCEHKRRYGVRTIKRATCTEEGLEFITCYDCDYSGERVVPPSHRWNQFYTIDKRVSASEAGQESLHCSVCDAIKEDSVREIIYGQQEVVNNQKVNDSITWSLSADGELQINGSGDMPSGDSYWKEYKDRIVKITISDGITSIGNYTFGQCHNLTDVSIPQSVTSIGSGVFSSCTSLEEITIPESVSIMGMNVFNDCTSLLRIKLPDKVVRIESMMFDGCKKLKEVVCSPKLNYIGSYAFNGCTNLEKAPLSDTVRKIEMYAFAGCTNLKSITVPQNVTILDAGVFCRCTGITEINIPSGVTAIGAHALLNCTNLKCIELPSSVTSISKNAFWKEGWPTGLEIIRFKGTKAQWDAFQLSSEEINNAEVFCEYDSAHEHVYEAIIIDEAQCMASGRQKLTCKKCGYSYEEEIPATGHSWNAGEITKEATCEEKGEKAYTCANCGNTTTEEIPATGHTEVKDEAVEATCEKDGLTEGSHCSVCKKVLKAQETIPSTGHKFGAWKTTHPADVFSVEKQSRSCSECGKEEEREVGSKLEKTMTVSVSSFPLKMKQKTKVLKVTGLADGDSIVSWKSSNTKIVKVSGKSNGTSTITAGKKTGKARITITLKSGLKKVITVSVQKNTVKTKKISGVSKNLKLKRKQKATLHPVIAPLTSIQKITYKSNNTKIVTVNSKGQITAKKKGTAVITVKSGNKTTKCKVTVK